MVYCLPSTVRLVLMGIISPKKPYPASKVLLALLLVILFPLFVVAVLLYFAWGVILYLAIWLTQRKLFVIFVYSDSPTWKDYIEKEILPYIHDRAVILNWSERNKWKSSLTVLAFRYFGGYRNFNPMGIVFRPFCFVKTYRFFEAFKEFKRGDSKKVEEMKRELFETLAI
jgi:hypothetical protein